MFQKQQIDAILVATLEAWKEARKAHVRGGWYYKIKIDCYRECIGQESIKNELEELKNCSLSDVVMVHDGNRPFGSEESIADNLVIFCEYGSDVAVYRGNV